MLQWLYTYVLSVCFICFKNMLQVFYLDVANVDLNVVYTCMLPVYVFKCFQLPKLMSQVFCLDIAYFVAVATHMFF
jgi:hypothetical protein